MEVSLFDWLSGDNYSSVATGSSIVIFVFSTWKAFTLKHIKIVTVVMSALPLLAYIYLYFVVTPSLKRAFL